jgi:hypothetical protein
MIAPAKQPRESDRGQTPPTIAWANARRRVRRRSIAKVARAPTAAIAAKTMPRTTVRPRPSSGIWLGSRTSDREREVDADATSATTISTPVAVIGIGPRCGPPAGRPDAPGTDPAVRPRLADAGSLRMSVIRRSVAGRLRWRRHRGMRMRIAQLAPTYERVPPRTYGGTELSVWLSPTELVAPRPRVTLFASGDSRTRRACQRDAGAGPLRLANRRTGSPTPSTSSSRNAQAAFLAADAADSTSSTTTRGSRDGPRRDRPDAGRSRRCTTRTPAAPRPIWDAYPWFHHERLGRERATFPSRGALPPIHHGIDVWTPSSPTPPVDRGDPRWLPPVPRPVQSRRRAPTGRSRPPASRPPADPRRQGRSPRHLHVREAVEPWIDATGSGPSAMVGGSIEAGSARGRDALLFPIEWDEPFGLVMVEALAAGTPVIGFRRASVPEDRSTTPLRLRRERRRPGMAAGDRRLASDSTGPPAAASRRSGFTVARMVGRRPRRCIARSSTSRERWPFGRRPRLPAARLGPTGPSGGGGRSRLPAGAAPPPRVAVDRSPTLCAQRGRFSSSPDRAAFARTAPRRKARAPRASEGPERVDHPDPGSPAGQERPVTVGPALPCGIAANARDVVPAVVVHDEQTTAGSKDTVRLRDLGPDRRRGSRTRRSRSRPPTRPKAPASADV